jgi:iron-sulfur cluster assembly protein
MPDESIKDTMMFDAVMNPSDSVWRTSVRGHTASNGARSIAVTPIAASEVRKQGRARGAMPVFRIRLARQSATRELVEWIGDVDPTDVVFQSEGIEIAIDPQSLSYLGGLTLDFRDGAFRLDRI